MNFAWAVLLALFVGHAGPLGAGPCEDLGLRRRTFSAEALPLPNEDRIKVAFFDADDTLRTSKSRPGQFVDAVDDIRILPGVADHLRRLNQRGWLVVIVSNQGGVPKYRSLEQIDRVLARTVDILRESGAIVNYYDFAETYDRFRKPGTGMVDTLLERLRQHFGRPVTLDRERSFMVGDAAYTAADRRPDGTAGTDRSNSDRLFAENLGLAFYVAADYFAAPL